MIPSDRQIYAKLYVGRTDGLTWEDVSDYLSRVEVNLGDVSSIGTGSSGVDGRVRQMDFTLRNEGVMLPRWADTVAADELYVVGDDVTTVVGDELDGGELLVNLLFGVANDWARDSFSPRDRDSAWNQFGGVYAPLLWPNREVQLQVAVTSPGVVPAAGDWVTLFHGYLGDNITTGGPTIACSCRDLAKRLQDTYIETVRQYGSEAGVAAETVIQQILDDNLGAGAVTLYCPVSPGFMVRTYQLEYKSVWDAIQEVASQIGWFLGYRWDSATSAYRLTLMQPPRTKSASNPDFVLDYEDDFYTEELDINDADIRNAIKVTYRDSATGQRATVTVEDATSIAEYGRRAMQIEESDTSLIDTSAEATALANAALSDLKDLTATTRLDMPLLPTMDVFAGITVKDPRISSTVDFYGVESVRHTLEWGEDNSRFRTESVGSGRVVGAHTRWLAMQTRPGSPGQPVNLPVTGATLQVPSGLTASAWFEEWSLAPSLYLDVTWNALTGKALADLDHYEVRLNLQGSSVYSYFQSTTNRMRISPAVPNRTYELVVRWFDRKGAVSGWSSVYSITTPKDSIAPNTPTGLTLSPLIRGFAAQVNYPTDYDFDGFEWYVSTSSTRPATATMAGKSNRVEFANLTPGVLYYVWVRAYDTSGNFSNDYAYGTVTAGAGITDDGKTAIEGNTITTRDGSGVARVVQGNISGQLYSGYALPAGTYGFYAKKGGLYLEDYPRLIAAGSASLAPWFGNTTVGAEFSTSASAAPLGIPGSVSVPAGRKLIAAVTAEQVLTPSGVVLEGIGMGMRAKDSGGTWQTALTGPMTYTNFEAYLNLWVRVLASYAATSTNCSVRFVLLEVEQ